MIEGVGMFGGLTLAGVLAMAWDRVRGCFNLLTSLVIVKADLQYAVGMMLHAHLERRFRRSSIGGRLYSAKKDHIRSRNRMLWLVQENVPPNIRMYWRRFPIWETRTPERALGFSSVSFFRGTFDIEKLLVDSAKDFNEHQTGLAHSYRIVRKSGSLAKMQQLRESKDGPSRPPESDLEESGLARVLGWDRTDVGRPHCEVPPRERVWLPEPWVFDDATRWKKSESWYRQRGIPWRRGYLLKGDPGTGKSTLARCLAQELDLPLFVLDLSLMSNDDMNNAWAECLQEAPCIVLLEDFDSVFHQRVNQSKHASALTFDCLLNCISGVQSSDGILTIFTVNDATKLDRALYNPDGQVSSRPGRIDRALEMPRMTEQGRKAMAARILAGSNVFQDAVVMSGEGMTGAQFEEHCVQAALEDFWRRAA